MYLVLLVGSSYNYLFLRMSLSSSPAPVANLDMVPPTWHRTGDWPDGRTKRLLRLRTSSVSMHQSLSDSQPDRLCYAHPRHLFPDLQAPSRSQARSSLRSLAPFAYVSSNVSVVARSSLHLLVIQLAFDNRLVSDVLHALVTLFASVPPPSRVAPT